MKKKITALLAGLALLGGIMVACSPSPTTTPEAIPVYALINPGKCETHFGHTVCNFTKLPRWIRIL